LNGDGLVKREIFEKNKKNIFGLNCIFAFEILFSTYVNYFSCPRVTFSIYSLSLFKNVQKTFTHKKLGKKCNKF
jgi:hypothetical protein